MTRDLSELGPGDFQPLVGERFRVVVGETGLELELAEVRLLPPHSYRAEPFALLFRGPLQPALPQRTYTLVHPTCGQLALFLVPVQGAAGAMSYEAILN